MPPFKRHRACDVLPICPPCWRTLAVYTKNFYFDVIWPDLLWIIQMVSTSNSPGHVLAKAGGPVGRCRILTVEMYTCCKLHTSHLFKWHNLSNTSLPLCIPIFFQWCGQLMWSKPGKQSETFSLSCFCAIKPPLALKFWKHTPPSSWTMPHSCREFVFKWVQPSVISFFFFTL